MLRYTVLSLSILLAGGCGATVYPQPQPIHPVAVYIADYGIHSSLLLPTRDGRYVEYAFGDWNYAALNHCWPNDALGALLISFQSALGRRYIDLPPGQTQPHPVHPSPHKLQAVYASQSDVVRVLQELEARYRRDMKVVLYNPDNLMDYVKDDQHYSVINNCNHLTAHCLREMGCEVRGLTVLSGFDVAPTPKIAPAVPAQLVASPATMPTAGTN
jgi:hypothetical protein